MSRVWKKFLSKIAFGVGMVTYTFATTFGVGLLFEAFGFGGDFGVAVGATVFILLPILAFAIKESYDNAKREVELENMEMMRTLKGNDRSSLYEN